MRMEDGVPVAQHNMKVLTHSIVYLLNRTNTHLLSQTLSMHTIPIAQQTHGRHSLVLFHHDCQKCAGLI